MKLPPICLHVDLNFDLFYMDDAQNYDIVVTIRARLP